MTDYSDNVAKREQVQMPELYEIDSGDIVERFTSYNIDLTFRGDVFKAAPIKRGQIHFDSNLGTQSVDVSAATSTQFKSHIALTPINPAKVTVWRAVADDLTQYIKIFSGQVQSVSSKGIISTAKCIGKNSILDARFPKTIYQSTCNHVVFDDNCKVLADKFKVIATVSGISGTDYTSSAFSAYADGYFDFGYARSGSAIRMITRHIGDTITLQVQFDASVGVGDNIELFPGCDGAYDTCVAKFNNIDNFLGMTTIPSKNPCIWGFK